MTGAFSCFFIWSTTVRSCSHITVSLPGHGPPLTTWPYTLTPLVPLTPVWSALRFGTRGYRGGCATPLFTLVQLHFLNLLLYLTSNNLRISCFLNIFVSAEASETRRTNIPADMVCPKDLGWRRGRPSYGLHRRPIPHPSDQEKERQRHCRR